MNYESYLSSDKWRSLRLEVLSRDCNRCQTCLSEEDLEVHHKTYERLGEENLEDLITLCHECHEAITNVIRRRRYSKRAIAVEDTGRKTPIVSVEVTHGKTIIEVSDHVRSTPAIAFRANRRSAKSLCQADEADQQQTRKDGRRF